MKSLLIFVCIWDIAFGAKILMVLTNINSHVLKFSRLAEGLSKQRHTIRMILPSNNKMARVMSLNKNFTVTYYPVDIDIPYANSAALSEIMIRIAFSESSIQKIKLFSDVEIQFSKESVKECESLMENNATIQFLKNGGFEFAIMDPWSSVSCYFLLPSC